MAIPIAVDDRQRSRPQAIPCSADSRRTMHDLRRVAARATGLFVLTVALAGLGACGVDKPAGAGTGGAGGMSASGTGGADGTGTGGTTDNGASTGSGTGGTTTTGTGGATAASTGLQYNGTISFYRVVL